jgi:hypothetical protein
LRNFEHSATIRVEAAQWIGDNLDEMKELLKPYIEGDEDGPFVYSDYVEPYFFASSKISGGGYNMLQFYAWGDDQEVDPGRWVVVYSDDEGEIMDNEQFEKMGFRQ